MANEYLPPPPFRHLSSEVSRSRLIELRQRVTPILANNLLPHFTDHSVTHSDSLTKFIDGLVEPLQASVHRLSEDELIALYSACYLHDIGMQYEHAGSTQVITRLGLTQRWEDLSEDTRRNLLRAHHAAISAEMIMMSVHSAAPIIGIQLKPDHFPQYVAAICEGHTLDTDSPRYHELTKDGPNFRMGLLSGLLRIADILDLSQRRANLDKARTLRLDLESQTHWWRHHYTEDIRIDQSEKLVSIWFDFPKSHFDEYRRIVPQLQMPWITAEFSRHMAVFHRYGLGWSVEPHIEQRAFSVAEVMPSEVVTEMLKQLRRQQLKEEEKHRHILSQQFSEAKPQIDRRLNEIEARKDSISPRDYLKELSRLAIDLFDLGLKRSAWMLLRGDFHRMAASLDLVERLEIGLKLASMMFEDARTKDAIQVVRELLPLADQLPDGDIAKFTLWRLWAECLIDVGVYDEAVSAVERAIALAPSTDVKGELQAQLAELHFLAGKLEKVLAS